jgi:hypothetical protein
MHRRCIITPVRVPADSRARTGYFLLRYNSYDPIADPNSHIRVYQNLFEKTSNGFSEPSFTIFQLWTLPNTRVTIFLRRRRNHSTMLIVRRDAGYLLELRFRLPSQIDIANFTPCVTVQYRMINNEGSVK